jgi:hypothetical protein
MKGNSAWRAIAASITHAAHRARMRLDGDHAETREAGHGGRGPDDRDTRRVMVERRDEEYHGTE